MLTSAYGVDGNPFGVFCTDEDCPNHQTLAEKPIWSEECKVVGKQLCCPICEKPVVKSEAE